MSNARRLLCTYFDSLYLARGITMLRSLRRWDPAASILVMALDAQCAAVLKSVFDSQIAIITLDALHAADPGLAAIRDHRSVWAFYAAHKPAFLLSVLREQPIGSAVVFIDADTWFFSSPEPVWNELEGSNIGFSPHRFCEGKEYLAQYGNFNAGFIVFRVTPETIRCVSEWRTDCLEWCDEQPQPDGRFMNQGYLNRWPERYSGVQVIRHPGVNLAPWNVNGHRLECTGETIQVDGEPLIFYHFSATYRDGNGDWYALANDFPSQRELIIDSVYAPYARAVEDEYRNLGGVETCGTVRSVTIEPDAVRVLAKAP